MSLLESAHVASQVLCRRGLVSVACLHLPLASGSCGFWEPGDVGGADPVQRVFIHPASRFPLPASPHHSALCSPCDASILQDHPLWKEQSWAGCSKHLALCPPLGADPELPPVFRGACWAPGAELLGASTGGEPRAAFSSAAALES